MENEIYPGMEEMLKMLYNKGIKLAVASSKPRVFVEKILE
jgi:phosphoglycolate phosphatase